LSASVITLYHAALASKTKSQRSSSSNSGAQMSVSCFFVLQSFEMYTVLLKYRKKILTWKIQVHRVSDKNSQICFCHNLSNFNWFW